MYIKSQIATTEPIVSKTLQKTSKRNYSHPCVIMSNFILSFFKLPTDVIFDFFFSDDGKITLQERGIVYLWAIICGCALLMIYLSIMQRCLRLWVFLSEKYNIVMSWLVWITFLGAIIAFLIVIMWQTMLFSDTAGLVRIFDITIGRSLSMFPVSFNDTSAWVEL